MSVTIRTEDGAVGKSITAKRKKINSIEQTVCSISVQMQVSRREWEALCGLPNEFCNHLYGDDGMPVAQVSLLWTKLELDCNGKITRGGDAGEEGGKPPSVLPIKNAIASDCRFVPEPNTAAFICKLAWLAEGDEVEEVSELLGAFCDIDLTFTIPAEQHSLALGAGGVSQDALANQLREMLQDLALLDIEMPGDDHPIWKTISPKELKRVQAFIAKSKDGKKAAMPSVLKPLIGKGA